MPQLSATVHWGSAPAVPLISGFCQPVLGPSRRRPLNVVRVRLKRVAPGGEPDRAARAGRPWLPPSAAVSRLVVGAGVGVEEDLVAGRRRHRGGRPGQGHARRDEGADARAASGQLCVWTWRLLRPARGTGWWWCAVGTGGTSPRRRTCSSELLRAPGVLCRSVIRQVVTRHTTRARTEPRTRRDVARGSGMPCARRSARVSLGGGLGLGHRLGRDVGHAPAGGRHAGLLGALDRLAHHALGLLAAGPVRALDGLAGLEVLVGLEEVLDLEPVEAADLLELGDVRLARVARRARRGSCRRRRPRRACGTCRSGGPAPGSRGRSAPRAAPARRAGRRPRRGCPRRSRSRRGSGWR